MDDVLKSALQPSLRFQREANGVLTLQSGVDNAPCDLAFTVYGKRLHGAGDAWEAFSCFARPAGKSTTHYSTGYGLFSGLEGGKSYKFKFKFVPQKSLVAGREAEGMGSYYNGVIETDWMDLAIPGRSDRLLVGGDDAVRNDALFDGEWKSFKISTNLGDEYWIGAGGFFNNIIGTSPSGKPGAFCLRLLELESKDAQGQVKTAYQRAVYHLYNNNGFPLYQLDGLFPEPGEYQFSGKIHFLSMSGKDLAEVNLAVPAPDGDGYLVGVGDMDSAQAAPLLESLKKKYPCHSIDLPTTKIKALSK